MSNPKLDTMPCLPGFFDSRFRKSINGVGTRMLEWPVSFERSAPQNYAINKPLIVRQFQG
jgi:hypothetical protein